MRIRGRYSRKSAPFTCYNSIAGLQTGFAFKRAFIALFTMRFLCKLPILFYGGRKNGYIAGANR